MLAVFNLGFAPFQAARSHQMIVSEPWVSFLHTRKR